MRGRGIECNHILISGRRRVVGGHVLAFSFTLIQHQLLFISHTMVAQPGHPTSWHDARSLHRLLTHCKTRHWMFTVCNPTWEICPFEFAWVQKYGCVQQNLKGSSRLRLCHNSDCACSLLCWLKSTPCILSITWSWKCTHLASQPTKWDSVAQCWCCFWLCHCRLVLDNPPSFVVTIEY